MRVGVLREDILKNVELGLHVEQRVSLEQPRQSVPSKGKTMHRHHMEG